MADHVHCGLALLQDDVTDQGIVTPLLRTHVDVQDLVEDRPKPFLVYRAIATQYS